VIDGLIIPCVHEIAYHYRFLLLTLLMYKYKNVVYACLIVYFYFVCNN
jgi:hypothetical protein